MDDFGQFGVKLGRFWSIWNEIGTILVGLEFNLNDSSLKLTFELDQLPTDAETGRPIKEFRTESCQKRYSIDGNLKPSGRQQLKLGCNQSEMERPQLVKRIQTP